MSVGLGRLGAWGVAAALVMATGAVSEPLPPAPLKRGETLFVMADGCAVIFNTTRWTPKQLADNRNYYGRYSWQGVCRNGLAHGKGKITYPARDQSPAGSYDSEFFLGRTPMIRRDEYGKTWYMAEDGQHAAATDDASLDTPVWYTYEDRERGLFSSTVVVNGAMIWTFKSCSGGTCDYKLYSYVSSQGGAGTYTDCPDLHSYVGCDALWRQMAGPLIASYRSIRPQVQAVEPGWRPGLMALNAARDARFTALDNASAEAFRRSQTAAEAEGGKAERDFKAKLSTANAGQLYAMADEFERAGETGKAAQAFRALLSRFPDHALAVTAAQHLSALPAPRPAAGQCDPGAEEQQVGMALNAAMGRIAPSNAQWQYEAILAATERAAAAWSRCPGHPSSASKLRAYQATYVEVARKCAMISPTGACKPDMH